MKTKSAVTIHTAADLSFAPRIERIDNPPARPTFRTVYGAEVRHFTDDLDAFEEHGRNMRHAAECDGLLDTWGGADTPPDYEEQRQHLDAMAEAALHS